MAKKKYYKGYPVITRKEAEVIEECFKQDPLKNFNKLSSNVVSDVVALYDLENLGYPIISRDLSDKIEEGSRYHPFYYHDNFPSSIVINFPFTVTSLGDSEEDRSDDSE